MRYYVPILYAEEKQLLFELGVGDTLEEAEQNALIRRQAQGEYDEELFRCGGDPISAEEFRVMADRLDAHTEEDLVITMMFNPHPDHGYSERGEQLVTVLRRLTKEELARRHEVECMVRVRFDDNFELVVFLHELDDPTADPNDRECFGKSSH